LPDVLAVRIKGQLTTEEGKDLRADAAVLAPFSLLLRHKGSGSAGSRGPPNPYGIS